MIVRLGEPATIRSGSEGGPQLSAQVQTRANEAGALTVACEVSYPTLGPEPVRFSGDGSLFAVAPATTDPARVMLIAVEAWGGKAPTAGSTGR